MKFKYIGELAEIVIRGVKFVQGIAETVEDMALADLLDKRDGFERAEDAPAEKSEPKKKAKKKAAKKKTKTK